MGDETPKGTWAEGPFVVVVNRKGQYSIWPLGREIPAGWSACERSGSRQECLDYIEKVWTDLRPKPRQTPSPSGGDPDPDHR